jgi:hypothetical protein
MGNDFPQISADALAKRDEIYAAFTTLQGGLADLSRRIERLARIKSAWNSEDESVTIQ